MAVSVTCVGVSILNSVGVPGSRLFLAGVGVAGARLLRAGAAAPGALAPRARLDRPSRRAGGELMRAAGSTRAVWRRALAGGAGGAGRGGDPDPGPAGGWRRAGHCKRRARAPAARSGEAGARRPMRPVPRPPPRPGTAGRGRPDAGRRTWPIRWWSEELPAPEGGRPIAARAPLASAGQPGGVHRRRVGCRAGTSPIPSARTALRVAGFLKLDAIHDTGPYSGDASDLPNLSLRGGPEGEQRHGLTRLHARESRLSLGTFTDTGGRAGGGLPGGRLLRRRRAPTPTACACATPT